MMVTVLRSHLFVSWIVYINSRNLLPFPLKIKNFGIIAQDSQGSKKSLIYARFGENTSDHIEAHIKAILDQFRSWERGVAGRPFRLCQVRSTMSSRPVLLKAEVTCWRASVW